MRMLSSPRSRRLCAVCSFLLVVLIPKLCRADFDSSLVGIQVKLTSFVLPTLAVIGMGIAAAQLLHGLAKREAAYGLCNFGLHFWVWGSSHREPDWKSGPLESDREPGVSGSRLIANSGRN